MSIRKLELLHIAVPLKNRVKHASHEREESENLVVRVTLSDGVVGYGEGVPRSYVTGETVGSSFTALSAVDVGRHFGRPDSYVEVIRKLDAVSVPVDGADDRGMAGNAARCALELAVLDAYGRRFHQSVGDAIRLAACPGVALSERPTRVRYSGAITASSRAKEASSAWLMWLYGFEQVKVKVGVDGQDDPGRLRELRGIFGKSADLRLDANEAWAASEVVERVRPLLPSRPSVLEQPVRHDEVGLLAGLRPSLGVPVMLDESLCGYPDAVKAVEMGTADMFNVRLSKCGGILKTLRIVGLARGAGLGVQLGCHPGETALLSAAGRHFASTVRGLRFVEGSYDGHLLEGNVTSDDLTFGYGGWAPPLEGDGLGINVDPVALERMTLARKEVTYD